jgi:hypothetical protein
MATFEGEQELSLDDIDQLDMLTSSPMNPEAYSPSMSNEPIPVPLPPHETQETHPPAPKPPHDPDAAHMDTPSGPELRFARGSAFPLQSGTQIPKKVIVVLSNYVSDSPSLSLAISVSCTADAGGLRVRGDGVRASCEIQAKKGFAWSPATEPDEPLLLKKDTQDSWSWSSYLQFTHLSVFQNSNKPSVGDFILNFEVLDGSEPVATFSTEPITIARLRGKTSKKGSKGARAKSNSKSPAPRKASRATAAAAAEAEAEAEEEAEAEAETAQPLPAGHLAPTPDYALDMYPSFTNATATSSSTIASSNPQLAPTMPPKAPPPPSFSSPPNSSNSETESVTSSSGSMSSETARAMSAFFSSMPDNR